MSIKSINTTDIAKLTSGQVIIDLKSIVKEAIENSIDAESTKIEVNFVNYGLDQIVIQDNGKGIDPKDYASVCLRSHTSKLQSLTDLERISTLGFRGEALNAICCLCDLKIVTSSNFPVIHELTFTSLGELESQTKKPPTELAGSGTKLCIQKLFKSFPVRLKNFEKNVKKEFNKAVALLTQYLIIYPQIKFSITNVVKGKKQVIFYTKGGPKNSPLDNMLTIFGTLGARGLLPIDIEINENVRLEGYISNFSFGLGRNVKDRQFVYINKRPVMFKKLTKIVNEVFQNFNHVQFPVFILNLHVGSEILDLNLLPDKSVVFIHDEMKIVDTLREKLVSYFEAQDNYVYPKHLPQIKKPNISSTPVDLDKPNSNELTSSLRDTASPANNVEIPENKNNDRDTKSLDNDVETSMEKNDSIPNADTEKLQDIENLQDIEVGIRGSPQLTRTHSSATSAGTGNDDEISISNCTLFVNEEDEGALDEDDVRVIADQVGCKISTTIQENDLLQGRNLVCENDECLDQREQDSISGASPTSETINGEAAVNAEINKKTLNVPQSKEYEDIVDTYSVPNLLSPEQKSRTTTSPQAMSPERLENQNPLSNLNPSQSLSTFKFTGSGENSSSKHSEDDDPYGKNFFPAENKGESILVRIGNIEVDPKYARRMKSELLHNVMKPISLEDPKFVKIQPPAQGTNEVVFDDLALEEQESKLSLYIISKSDFEKMDIIGQFNLGFILVKQETNGELANIFIVDQHASDEKFNFEKLNKEFEISYQTLISPIPLELNVIERNLVLEHEDVFRKNGFTIEYREARDDHADGIFLKTLPTYKNALFSVDDFYELLDAVANNPHNKAVRVSKIRNILAMKACRSSIMIGKALTIKQMEKIVKNLSLLNKPWNCPHGRPTMRHLSQLEWNSTYIDYEL